MLLKSLKTHILIYTGAIACILLNQQYTLTPYEITTDVWLENQASFEIAINLFVFRILIRVLTLPCHDPHSI